MSSCANPPANAPVVRLTLAGTGEPLLRMEKRLSCAAGGAGVRLELVIRKDIDALDIPHEETPLLLHEGKLIFSGLPRAEEIEAWLKNVIHQASCPSCRGKEQVRSDGQSGINTGINNR